MKTNILHIVSQLKIIGGMEKYIELFFSCYGNKNNKILKIYKGENNINIDDRNIFSLEEKSKNNNILKKIFLLFFRSKKIANFCNKNNIEYTISHGGIDNLFNIFSSFLGNKSKVIIIIHNKLDKYTLGAFIYYLSKYFYKYAYKIICISKEQEEDIKKIIGKKDNITTIYNPFDYNKIKIEKKIKLNGKKSIIKYNGKVNFCTISRLDKNKNNEYLIKTFYYFQKNNKNSQLFILGDGKEMEYLKSLIKKIGLDKKIFLLGHKKNIYNILNNMDFFLFVGKSEGFGRTLIDALSCGVPILSHDYKYGAKEIIRNNKDLSTCTDIEIHENGILSPFMDMKKYIEAMNSLLETKFNKNKILKNIEKYNTKNFKKEWNKILK